MTIEARDTVGVSAGQRVFLSVPEGAALKASATFYLLPLAALVVVGAVVERLAGGLIPGRYLPLVAVASGFAAMAATYFILQRKYRRRMEDALRPVIVESIDSPCPDKRES